MRVVSVTRVWPTQRPGGMPFVACDRAVELAHQGHDVHVVTTWLSQQAGQAGPAITREENGCTVHYTRSPSHQWSQGFARECAKLANSLKPDIIHSDSFDRANVWWASLPDRPRIAVTMHGFGMGGFLTKWNECRTFGKPMPQFPTNDIKAEAEGLASADVVVGVSRWEWRMLRDQYGLDARLVYNPIPPEFFGPPSTKQRTGFLCAAISGAHTRGFEMAKEAAKRAGVRFLHAKNIPRHEMPNLYDQAFAVVLPTAYAQGFDLTIAEGRARGVPAIMTPTGSYLDEAEHFDTLVPLGDVEALAGAMRRKQETASPSYADRHRPEEHVRAWLEAVT